MTTLALIVLGVLLIFLVLATGWRFEELEQRLREQEVRCTCWKNHKEEEKK